MKRMSFMLTVPAMLDESKDVTRRLGWEHLKPGDQFLAVEQCQGLVKGGLKRNGEKPLTFGVMECVSNTPEPLREIASRPCRWNPSGDFTERETDREGFPNLKPSEFVTMFCSHMKRHPKTGKRVTPETIVNRIQFKRVQP